MRAWINVMKLALFLSLAGCAEPKYASAPPPTPIIPTGEVAKCTITMPKSGQCVQLTWIKTPTAEETGTLLVTVIGPNWNGLPTTADFAGEIRAHLWMPSMNHGSTPIMVTPVGAGTFRLDEVYFIMPGDWTIHLQIWRDGALFEEGLFALEI